MDVAIFTIDSVSANSLPNFNNKYKFIPIAQINYGITLPIAKIHQFNNIYSFTCFFLNFFAIPYRTYGL